MAERFNQRVSIGPVQSATQAPARLMSLADRLQTFKQGQFQKAETLAVQRGVESAGEVELEKANGITQRPEEKKASIIGGVEIEAHNKALRDAYVSSLETDIKELLATTALENPDDLAAFNEKVEGIRKGVLSGVDPLIKRQVEEFFNANASSLKGKVQAANIKKDNRAAAEALEGSIEFSSDASARAARNGDNEGAAAETLAAFQNLDRAVEGGFISAEDAATQKREIERETAEQKMRREFDLLSDQSIRDAKELVKEKRKKVPSGWTPDEWDRYLTSQDQEINRKASAIGRETKKLKEEISAQESIQRGVQFMNPDIPADPAKSGQDRKDVNNAFNAVIAPSLAGMEPGDQIKTVEDFIQNTGVIPDVIISKSNAAMRSGAPDNVLVFSKIVNDLAASRNPSVLRDLPDQTRAVSLQIASAVDAGLDLETATEIARKNAYGLTDAERNRIKLEAQAMRPMLPEMMIDLMDRNFDPSFVPFVEEPEVNASIQADFNVAFENFMTMTNGDAEQSALLAESAIVKKLGVNDIDGDFRVMKYAPSVFYGQPGVKDDWMEEQFKKDLAGFGDIDNFRLAVNTKSLETGEPTYMVMNVDQDGIISPVLADDGSLVEWAPDFTQTREYLEIKARPQAEKQEAKEIRRMKKRLDELLGAHPEVKRGGDA